MQFLDLVIAALASTQLVWLWLDGSVFARMQHGLRQRRDDRNLTGRVCELLTCQFCLLPWTTLLVVITLSLTAVDSPWRWPILALAATRLGHTWNEFSNRMTGSESRDIELDDAGDVGEPFPAASAAPPLPEATYGSGIQSAGGPDGPSVGH